MDKPSKQPPKLAEKFLKWFCSPDVIESLQGDLYELYERRKTISGKRAADLHFFVDVMDVCRPFAWKKRLNTQNNHLDMFKNNLKIKVLSLFCQSPI